MKKVLFAVMALMMTVVFSVARADVDLKRSPDVLVSEVTNNVLDQIRKDPGLKAGDPRALNKLIDVEILPYVDFARMTRMAVGPQWRSANSEQKSELQTRFRELLMAVYSGALKEVADYKLSLKNNKIDPNERVVIVRCNLISSQKDPVGLDYRLVKNNDGDWKIFDLNVGGIWLVENYRSQFASVISNGGLSALIAQLKDRAAKNQSGK